MVAEGGIDRRLFGSEGAIDWEPEIQLVEASWVP